MIHKMDFSQFQEFMENYNSKHQVKTQFGKPYIDGYIVFSADNWTKEYSLESRTYRVISSNKAFLPDMCGTSIFGNSMDGLDIMVKLTDYSWKIDYCYVDEDIFQLYN